MYLVDRHGDPWGTVVEAAGAYDPADFEAVYARIPDPAAFLDARPARPVRTAGGLPAGRTSRASCELSFYEDGVVDRLRQRAR